MDLRNRHNGSQGLNQSDDGKSWLFQVRREDLFIQGHLVFDNFDRILKKREGKTVARGKDDYIDVILPGAILKYGSCLREFLHVPFHLHQARDDAVWQFVIDGWMLTQRSVSGKTDKAEVRVEKKGRKESAREYDPAPAVKHARVYPFYLAEDADTALRSAAW